MLDQGGFDLWADGYDKSVGCSDEADEMKAAFPSMGFEQISHCAGLLSMKKENAAS